MSTCYFVSGLLGFILACALTIFIRCRSQRLAPKTISLFKERLSYYAWMQDSEEEIFSSVDVSWQCQKVGFCIANTSHCPRSFVLTKGQHKILLGVLKKIEAKAGVIATILIFALTAVITILASGAGPKGWSANSLYFGAGILSAALITSVDAVAHIGQSDYIKLAERSIQEIRGRELQKQLIRDAIRKEDIYRANWWICLLFIIASGFAYFANWASW